jgi:hypothetical protein
VNSGFLFSRQGAIMVLKDIKGEMDDV